MRDGALSSLSVTMQLNEPLTLTLSPSDGERESVRAFKVASPFGDRARRHEIFSLSPSEGERVGVRILRKHFSRLEPLNRQRQVGLGVLTPPRPSRVSSLLGGGVRTPNPTFRFVGRERDRSAQSLEGTRCD